jgi:2-keto-4-pentenoate hydratase/2-oxohepta-3-ene-1,7-dioic acid hydratase in catechol pathway
MRFATADINGAPKVIIVSSDSKRYWDIQEFLPGFKGDMVDLITAVPDPKAGIKVTAEGRPMTGVRLLAPIISPRRNVFLVGKNYHEHAREFNKSGFDGSNEDVPPLPSYFTKPASSIVGPDAPVLSHQDVTQEVDYENEFTVIIGKGGRGIKKADAYKHVWGYTIVNDVTARDLQKQARQWFLGKSLDTFCPMGPWIVTADEIDPENTQLKTWINGELRQNANTGDLIFDIPTLIEVLSAGITLQPGDIIATGTAAGVGIGFKPPKFLKPGDEMKLEISGIGTLINRIE